MDVHKMETLLTPIDIRRTYVLRKEGIHTILEGLCAK